MNEFVMNVFFIDRILLGSKSDISILIKIDLERVDAGQEDIQTEVKF